MQNGKATLDNRMAVSYKAYAHHVSQQSHSEVWSPKRNENTYLHRELFILYLEYGGSYTTGHVCQNS